MNEGRREGKREGREKEGGGRRERVDGKRRMNDR